MTRPISYTLGADPTPRQAHPTWYRGPHCNFLPSQTNLAEPDAIDRYVLAGWTPPAPFIRRDQVITAFGSCFAAHLSSYLRQKGFTTGESLVDGPLLADFSDSHVVRFGAGIVNTFALRQQFEWALAGARFDEDLWYDKRGDLVGYSERARAATARLFARTEVFILTLGLLEVWTNRQTGNVFWRAIPQDRFDPAVHGFKVANVAENVANLNAIIELVRTHRPGATLVFTLSPVPLIATFRPVSCVTANAASKAILRASIDEVMRAREGEPGLYYWPGYEIVKELVANPYEEDNWHIRAEVVSLVMERFHRYFLLDEGGQAR